MDIQETMRLVEARYPFTAEKYPELEGASEEYVKQFAMRHMLLHMGKAFGKFSSVCEAEDHGATPDAAVLEEATIKLLINALRAAQMQGMDAEKIFSSMPRYLKPKA